MLGAGSGDIDNASRNSIACREIDHNPVWVDQLLAADRKIEFQKMELASPRKTGHF